MVTPSSFYLSVHFILRKVNEKWKSEDLQMPFYIEHTLYVYLKTGNPICRDSSCWYFTGKDLSKSFD